MPCETLSVATSFIEHSQAQSVSEEITKLIANDAQMREMAQKSHSFRHEDAGMGRADLIDVVLNHEWQDFYKARIPHMTALLTRLEATPNPFPDWVRDTDPVASFTINIMRPGEVMEPHQDYGAGEYDFLSQVVNLQSIGRLCMPDESRFLLPGDVASFINPREAYQRPLHFAENRLNDTTRLSLGFQTLITPANTALTLAA